MRILVTGKNGQVGYELVRSLSCIGDVIATGSNELNLCDLQTIVPTLEQIQPDIIINAAAYTAVDKAETEREQAFTVNAYAPEIMARYATKQRIPFVHYSTDYIFDGSKSTAWVETDAPNPLNVYGESKFEGEQRIMAQGGNHMIFRTSWVYGSRGHNFYNTMKRLAADKEQLSIVADQYGAPTWSRHLADVVSQIVLLSQQHADLWQKHSGIYHLSGQGMTSWYGFASAIFEKMAKQGERVPQQVRAISSADYPVPARRPANSCMDNSKLKQTFNLNLPDWNESLSYVMQH